MVGTSIRSRLRAEEMCTERDGGASDCRAAVLRLVTRAAVEKIALFQGEVLPIVLYHEKLRRPHAKGEAVWVCDRLRSISIFGT